MAADQCILLTEFDSLDQVALVLGEVEEAARRTIAAHLFPSELVFFTCGLNLDH